jgi:hypothetical protein
MAEVGMFTASVVKAYPADVDPDCLRHLAR